MTNPGIPGLTSAPRWHEATLSHGAATSRPAAVDWVRVSLVAVGCSAMIVVLAIALGLTRRGNGWGEPMAWAAMAGLVFIPAFRLAARDGIARTERLLLVVLTALYVHLAALVRAPTAGVGTGPSLDGVRMMIETRSVFAAGSDLPAPPLHSVVDILAVPLALHDPANAMVALAVLTAAARMSAAGCLFLMYERLGASARFAAIATLVVIAGATVLSFQVTRPDEALALALLSGVLLVFDRLCGQTGTSAGEVLLAVALTALLVLTDHLASYVCAVFVITITLVHLLAGTRSDGAWKPVAVAVAACLASVAWATLVGVPAPGGVGPAIDRGLAEAQALAEEAVPALGRLVAFGPADGTWSAVLAGLAATVMLAALAYGLGRTLALAWGPEAAGGLTAAFDVRPLPPVRRPTLLVLALCSLSFPLVAGLRLIPSGSELASRFEAFAVLCAAPVVAVSVMRLAGGRGIAGRSGVAGILAVLAVGGAAVRWDGPATSTPLPAAAVHQSADPATLSAVLWMRDRLGPGRRVAGDRAALALLAIHQDAPSAVPDPAAMAEVVLADTLTDGHIEAMGLNRLEFVLIDRRGPDTASSPAGSGPALRAAAIAKFDRVPGIDRIYDNGSVSVYDVRGLWNGH